MRKAFGLPILIALAILWLASQSVYIIDARQKAVLLRFGELVKTDNQPGIHFKMPVIYSIKRFDARVQTLDSPESEYLTLEKKQLIVDSYAKWRIDDVARFYRATNGDELKVRRLLFARVDNGLRNEFGERTVNEVVSGERDQLMAKITSQLDAIAREELGIEIVDIRVMKINLPDNVSNSVYQRMTTERQRIAQELRSRGREVAEGMRAAADKERTVILANAYKEAETLRGEGDNEAAHIYAEAFSKSPQFYDFYRSLFAYREVFGRTSNNFLILEPDSEFLTYLKSISRPTFENEDNF